jgi:hypothetical protein
MIVVILITYIIGSLERNKMLLRYIVKNKNGALDKIHDLNQCIKLTNHLIARALKDCIIFVNWQLEEA